MQTKVTSVSTTTMAEHADGGVVAELCPKCTLSTISRRTAKGAKFSQLPNGVYKLTHEEYTRYHPHQAPKWKKPSKTVVFDRN